MFAHDTKMDGAIKFSRFDHDSPFSTVSNHPFQLDDYVWKTPEHYYQCAKFKDLAYADKVANAATGQEAYEQGNRWFRRKVSDWKANRQVFMTRALYRKVKEYPEIAEALLETEQALLVETSLYDYYWGLGRDQRGQNYLGKIWMDIRQKLSAEDQES